MCSKIPGATGGELVFWLAYHRSPRVAAETITPSRLQQSIECGLA
jgi:hypothetical protein